MFAILLSLHILVFVMAFAFTAGIGILSARIARSRDARLIHDVFVAARPLQWTGAIGWLVAGALGAWMAVRAGIAFDAPWLLYSYAAFAVLLVAGLGIHAPWQGKVIAASAGGTLTPELDALLRSPLHPLASALSAVSFIALVYLMTAQPG